MTDNFTICAGTIGTGAWVSPDGGESWRQVRTGLWAESRVFGFAAHPQRPRTLLAGADDGIYRSDDGGEHFERLDSPMNALHVWKVAFDPTDPETIFAGTRPASLFRSTDGGRHWEKLRADMADECPNVRIPRVTALTVDPSDHRIVWAGVEVDGVRRSRDGGKPGRG
jgi:Sortilin, neurotensin receptor 3,